MGLRTADADRRMDGAPFLLRRVSSADFPTRASFPHRPPVTRLARQEQSLQSGALKCHNPAARARLWLRCFGVAAAFLPQTGEVCSLRCDLTASLSVLRVPKDGFGLRTSTFRLSHAVSLPPWSFLTLSLLSQLSLCSWFLASLQLFLVPSPPMQPRGQTPNPERAQC